MLSPLPRGCLVQARQAPPLLCCLWELAASGCPGSATCGMRQDQFPPPSAALLSLEREGAATHGALCPFQVRGFCLLCSKANCM